MFEAKARMIVLWPDRGDGDLLNQRIRRGLTPVSTAITSQSVTAASDQSVTVRHGVSVVSQCRYRSAVSSDRLIPPDRDFNQALSKRLFGAERSFGLRIWSFMG